MSRARLTPLLAATLAACGGGEAPQPPEEPPRGPEAESVLRLGLNR